ncbi:MAG: methyltransferase [Desertimonas sp.]
MTDFIRHHITIRELAVIDATDLSPSLRRIVLGGEQLDAFSDGTWDLPAFTTASFDDHVKVFLRDGVTGALTLPTQDDGHLAWPHDPRPVARDYTVRAYDAAERTLTLDFVRHEGGAAAGWAERARPGDRLHVAGPRGSHVYPSNDWSLLVGDETALPAISRWLDEADDDAVSIVVIEVPTAEDRVLGRCPEGVDVVWVVRDEADDPATCLVRALARLRFPDGTPTIWAGGEFTKVRAIRRHLADARGIADDAIEATSYYRAGVSQDAEAEAYQRLEALVSLDTPYAIRTLVTLGIPPLLDQGVESAEALAAQTGTQPRALTSLLRWLVPTGVIDEPWPGAFRLGTLGQPLLEDWLADDLHLDHAAVLLERAWAGLPHSLRTGQAAFPTVFGAGFWEYLDTRPAVSAWFDAMLAGWADEWVAAVAEAYDWDRFTNVADIGGGEGRLLAQILERHPQLRATLVEQASTARRAETSLAATTVAQRVEVAEGSFFDPWPVGPDAYVLAQVLHDWPDEQATAILRRGADVVGPNGRIIVVERMMDEKHPEHDHLSMDLTMLAMFGAAERTLPEFEGLAGAAGLSVIGSHSSGAGLTLIEMARTPTEP